MNSLNTYPLSFKSIGASALLIEWPEKIDKDILNDILRIQTGIENELTEVIIETINAYNSLTVIYNNEVTSDLLLQDKIRDLIDQRSEIAIPNSKKWEIPVCYHKDFGIDLEHVARQHGLATHEVIDIHSTASYQIYFTGFLPGFLYLGGLPATIHTPRKSTPRLRINKGAVAIGGQQTGIYPSESPGGWNIIGNCPVTLFLPQQNPPCFAMAGDSLTFCPVSISEHQKILKDSARGVFKIVPQ